MVTAGQSGGSTLIERFTAAGQPDPSFGSGGQAGGPAGFARAVALVPGGDIVVAGGGPGMFVERLTAGGARDASFGSGGVTTAGPLGGSAIGYAAAIQTDGKIVVAGSVNPTNTSIAVARFNTNGTLDSSFGSGGVEVLNLDPYGYELAQGVAIQPDGKIVLAGTEQGGQNAFFNGFVARLNTNGSYDTSFAGRGAYIYHHPGGGYDGFNAIALQNNGQIVVAGAATEANPNALFVRFNANGTPDSSFGSGGTAELSAGTSTAAPVGAFGVGIGGGGRIIGAGAVQLNGTDYRAGLWALTPNGAGDAEGGFAAQGGLADGQTGEGCALAIAPDGSLVTVGDSVSSTRSQSDSPCMPESTSTAFVARYTGFGPPPPPAPPTAAPTVSTGGASGVSQSAATVTGVANPNGLASSLHFDYGTTPGYGSSTPATGLGASSPATPASATITGLRPNTTYHYRLVSGNADGTSYGGDRTFKTAAPGRRLSASLHGVAKSYRLASILKHGISVKVNGNEACTVKGTLTISAADARHLKLGKHSVSIASGSASLKRGGAARLVLRLSKAFKRVLGHVRSLHATLHVQVVPRGGGRAVRLSKALTLRR